MKKHAIIIFSSLIFVKSIKNNKNDYRHSNVLCEKLI